MVPVLESGWVGFCRRIFFRQYGSFRRIRSGGARTFLFFRWRFAQIDRFFFPIVLTVPPSPQVHVSTPTPCPLNEYGRSTSQALFQQILRPSSRNLGRTSSPTFPVLLNPPADNRFALPFSLVLAICLRFQPGFDNYEFPLKRDCRSLPRYGVEVGSVLREGGPLHCLAGCIGHCGGTVLLASWQYVIGIIRFKVEPSPLPFPWQFSVFYALLPTTSRLSVVWRFPRYIQIRFVTSSISASRMAVVELSWGFVRPRLEPLACRKPCVLTRSPEKGMFLPRHPSRKVFGTFLAFSNTRTVYPQTSPL